MLRPLWAIGFRPFYLLAGLFAALSVPLWAARFAGWLGEWVYFSESVWHAHEMIFGYAFAVMVGFLFTAVRNWTGRPTPSGGTLAAIALAWLAARVLVFTPWTELAAIADAAFALAAAAGIAVPLIASGNRRNYFFIALLVLLGAVNLCFYLAKDDVLDAPVGVGLEIALDLILFVIAVMGGRVIPMFTANAIPGAAPRRAPWLDRAALAAVLLLVVFDAIGAPEEPMAVLAGLAALLHGARFLLWRPWRTVHRPLVWILHASYAWIVIHLALRAFGELGLIMPSLATHALTVGAIGGMTLGMMTRTARGHTGRPLEAGGGEVAAYVLIQLAALVRVFGPMFFPALYLDAIIVSGALWSLAFLAFTVVFWPVLTRPRLDGRPG
ncbi:MAG TPA: NnrS family protein [Burkholderiales bacterium]